MTQTSCEEQFLEFRSVSETGNIYCTDTREGDALTPRYVFMEEENLLGERHRAMGEFYNVELY
jgi:hypothetical protein